jgi:tetratricopeptide (TPR) repeat protein
VLFLQIRQAEVALADGRLDEAYKLVQSERLRSHRRGQALVTELIKALVERGKAHLSGERHTQALADCEKAQTLGGNLDDVLALRGEIEQAVVSNDRLRRQEVRVGMLQSAAQLVDSALAREDLDRAVAELMRARGNGCCDHRMRELDANVRSTLRSQVQAALDEGRLDQVQPLMDRLERLDPQGLATTQFRRAVEQARGAWASIDRGRPHEALELLRRLGTQLPGAKWIEQAISSLEQAERSLRDVRTGPLGLLTMDQPPLRHDSPTAWPLDRGTGFQPVQRAQQGLKTPATGGQLPSKYVLQVDGAGSYLVVTGSSVTLGPISSSRQPDVGLIADAGADVVSIERMEDDYFLKGASASTSGKLLSSGDKINISPRCRFVFNVPNPSSTTAVLDLTAGRLPRADMRRVILLDRDLIIGPGPASHVRADHLTESVVLQVRDGLLRCGSQPITPGTPVALAGGVSLVVTA